MENAANKITVLGTLDSLPQVSHENHGKVFYRFTLEVERLSGTRDILPVIVDQALLDTIDLSGGSRIRVRGEIRSYNSRTENIRRLHIFIFALELTVCEGEAENEVFLSGTVCKEPIFRRTPLGREICDVMLAVPRAYHRSDYLPCILWGRTAQEAARCAVGDALSLQGRMQSRNYQKLTEKGLELRTAYEISALSAQVETL